MSHRFPTLSTAWRGLGFSPGRSALTVATMAVGVATVTVAAAASRGAHERVKARLDRLGRNLLVVAAGKTSVVAGRRRQSQYVTTLEPRDAEALRDAHPAVSGVAPIQSKKLTIKRKNVVTSADVVGTGSSYPKVRSARVARGRFFSPAERRGRVRVAVLGRTVSDELYEPGERVEGSWVRINRVPFRVIGLMSERGSSLSGKDEDNQVFVPVTTALRRLFNITHLSTILVQVADGDRMEEVKRGIRTALRRNHRLRGSRPDDFTIQSQSELLEARAEISRRFDTVMVAVVAATLVVAGVGVFAVMTVGVGRRRAEIGLRRAVGATRRHIMRQFLLEALFLSALGGVFGVSLALLGSSAVHAGLGWPVSLDGWTLGGGVALSLVVGLGAGIQPARKASMLHPVEALRLGGGGGGGGGKA